MVAFFIAILALGALVLLGWVLFQVRGQQHRLEGRLDHLAVRLATRVADSAARERTTLTDALAGEVASPFNLSVLGGGRVTLEALLDCCGQHV